MFKSSNIKPLCNIFLLLQDLPGGSIDPRETHKEKKNYLNLLKSSADSKKPLYRMSKAEIDEELRKK